MSTEIESPIINELRHGLSALRGNWFWFVLVGVALIVLGMVAISSTVIASLAFAVFFGVLILMSGVAETIGAFWTRAWSGFFLHLLSGILAIVIGVLFLRRPVTELLVFTLLIAAFLMVGGIFKIVTALSYRFAAWGWPVLSGVIDVALGIMIWMEWPASALWVIGLFIGISMVFRGVHWIALGLALRALPVRSPA
jgi:uncharacterized membrane protein HdeD (DUF308 family)